MELKSLQPDKVEIRGFLKLDAHLRKHFGTVPPYFVELEKPITGLELSKQLKIERNDIEVIFVNGFAENVNHLIHAGDRIAFLPPGCPGPYRIALGFYGKNQDNEANFKIQR
jgi:molybdopterin converting factor small subunit